MIGNCGEKAGVHQPPPLPEQMDTEGEYDPQSLAKRVAIAFDRVAKLAEIDTVTIVQDGNTIILSGAVVESLQIARLHQIASQVDGTKRVRCHSSGAIKHALLPEIAL